MPWWDCTISQHHSLLRYVSCWIPETGGHPSEIKGWTPMRFTSKFGFRRPFWNSCCLNLGLTTVASQACCLWLVYKGLTSSQWDNLTWVRPSAHYQRLWQQSSSSDAKHPPGGLHNLFKTHPSSKRQRDRPIKTRIQKSLQLQPKGIFVANNKRPRTVAVNCLQGNGQFVVTCLFAADGGKNVQSICCLAKLDYHRGCSWKTQEMQMQEHLTILFPPLKIIFAEFICCLLFVSGKCVQV